MLPSPIHDNYWRNRLLTDEELAQTLEMARSIIEEERAKASHARATTAAFLKEMEGMGFHRTSSEYKYVCGRVLYRSKFSQLVYNIEDAQRNLRRKEEEARREQAQAAIHKERLMELAEEAKELGVDPIAYFGDEKGLKQAVDAAKEVKAEDGLATAPYYVKASFYGHCLRNDWSDGRKSYGCRELRSLDIPVEDAEYPELHALAKELQEDAGNWEGDDGRYFRDTYQRLDALLSEEDARLLDFLNKVRCDLHY